MNWNLLCATLVIWNWMNMLPSMNRMSMRSAVVEAGLGAAVIELFARVDL